MCPLAVTNRILVDMPVIVCMLRCTMQRSAAACDVSMVTSAHNKLVAVAVPLTLTYSTGIHVQQEPHLLDVSRCVMYRCRRRMSASSRWELA